MQGSQIFVSINSRLESNKEEEESEVTVPRKESKSAEALRKPPDRDTDSEASVQWFRGGLVFEAHRLLYPSA